MQFIDLKAQQQEILPQIEERISRVLRHGNYILGPEVGELEEKLADFCGARYCLTCSSGTDALLMALLAYGVGPGDAVITTPFTFIATAEVLALVGATPVFVDIDPQTYNLDPGHLERAIRAVRENDPSLHPLPFPASQSPGSQGTPLTLKGIIAVDIFGIPAEYEAITRLAGQSDLFVIADAAQSFGARYHGRMVGSMGDVTATSFFPAKPLGCYGDGGAVFTDDQGFFEQMRSIRVHGQGTDKYDNIRVGINGRLDTLQAAILLEKLAIFPRELAARQRVARQYGEVLGAECPDLVLPHVPEGLVSAWAQYSVLSENRNALMARLQEKNIPSAIYYPKPLHLQSVFHSLRYEKNSFPITEEICRTIFSLPMHPYLQEREILEIAAALAGN